MVYFQVSLVVVCFFTIWFLICIQQKNYGLVDIAWGLGMSVVAGYLLFQFQPNLQIKISLILIILWGLRLGLYLGKRNWGKPEDYRYVNLRKRWGQNHPYLKAFLNVFVLQGVLLYLMMFSSMNAVTHQNEINTFTLFLGLAVAVFGLAFETVGDYQLAKFKQGEKNRGKLMKSGLWSITRHPNYFGEILFWWGIYVMTFQSMQSLIGIISPLLITLLLNYVSGIPLLERKYADREDYIAYASETPRLLPFIGDKRIKK